MTAKFDQWRPNRTLTGSLLLAVTCTIAAAGGAYAKGGLGAAKPPTPGTGLPPALGTTAPAVPPTIFTDLANTHAFNVTGFLQDATVSNARCPAITNPSQFGGTVTVNSLTITVPCNTILQMPAATFTFADLLTAANGKFTTTGTPGEFRLNSNTTGTPLPSMEINVTGNIVSGEYISGLILVTQQSANFSQGYIVSIDNLNGALLVAASPGGPAQARVQINDPILKGGTSGRYSAGQSPDTRFSVDQDNPTITSNTGYPMCIPRFVGSDDPRCPARNRPLANAGCRNFRNAGTVLPTGRELSPPLNGQTFCSAFVMPNPSLALPTDPTSFEQVPFEVGDYVTFVGSLIRGDGKGPNGTATISANTITANVGVFTQPGTLPAYIAIVSMKLSSDTARTILGVPQEAPNRVILDAMTTDVTSIADIYLMDASLVDGSISNRWITPATMTGGTGAVSQFTTPPGQLIDGGITTQFVGPIPGRVRLQANKASPGILLSPTRYVRVALRQLCDPANVNAPAQQLGAAPGTMVACLTRANAANGLNSGQYFAPVFNFIFPENVVAGDPIVPNDFYDFNFLVSGEGPGTGQLTPKPW